MTKLQKIRVRLSEVRERLNEISGLEGEDFTDEIRAEAADLQAEYQTLEVRHRAAIVAEPEPEVRDAPPDAETRERIELRSRASLGRYLFAAMRGRAVDGAERELMEAAEIDDGIPIELWDVEPETRQAETRQDAVTAAPGTVGVNLAPIQPAIFAPSIAPRLGVEMPSVGSGTYASATITTSLTAGAKAAGAAQEATAAAFTVTSASPKRVSARLAVRIEDVAAIGQANFESALRENLSLALSAELDDQMLNGSGSAPNLYGIIKRLADPAMPGDAVATFDDFLSAFAGGIDGLWASRMNEVTIVCGVDTFRLSAKAFRDAGENHRGDVAFSDYARQNFGGWFTNQRMPAAQRNIQRGILYRRGRAGIRTAVCPHWGRVSIDDIYSGSAKGERFLTLHVLLGDVILTQPAAYEQTAFRLAV